MNCLEFKAALQSAIESHRPAEGDDLATHCRHCSDCRREWNEYQLLAQAVASWKETTPGVDLADSIVSRWLLETTGPVRFNSADSPRDGISSVSWDKVVLAPESPAFRPRSVDRTRAGQVFWIPGGLLLVFFLLIWQGGSPPENARRPMTSAINETDDTAAEQPVAELDALLQDVESGYWELANSAVNTVSDAADLLPMRGVGSNGMPLAWPPLMPRSPFTPTIDPGRTEGNPSGPLRQGFSTALDLLLEVVPATDLPTS